MKFRRRPAPVFLLLLPSLASALAAAAQDEALASLPTNAPEISKSRFDVGTKDAPFDGVDGKPHAGPWVVIDKNKPPTSDEKSSGKNGKTEVIMIDGERIPQTNDGVMDDPSRQKPLEGTTGTEGGVSERNKAQKAKEGQTGEKVEMTPASPKEAPPLPNSEENEIGKDKAKVSVDKGDRDDDVDALAGLEVMLGSLFAR